MTEQPTSDCKLEEQPSLAPANCSAAVLAREMLCWTRFWLSNHREYVKNSDPDCGSKDYHQGAVHKLEALEPKVERLCAEMGVSIERQPQPNVES